jgi:hypothetical protein
MVEVSINEDYYLACWDTHEQALRDLIVQLTPIMRNRLCELRKQQVVVDWEDYFDSDGALRVTLSEQELRDLSETLWQEGEDPKVVWSIGPAK